MNTRRLLFFALALVVLGMLLTQYIVSHRPSGPLEISLWYWHSPFRLTHDDVIDLKAVGVRKLFVRAGTISNSGDSVHLILPQTWQPSPGSPPIHLVFALDYGIVRHFEAVPNGEIAQELLSSLSGQRRNAERAGLLVEGIQIDFDCPTRLLPKYADLLRDVRRALPERTILSITSLPTWFTSTDLRQVVEQVDFYCPQFYETQVGRTLAEVRPVSDPCSLRHGLDAARRLGTPFYAGIPAYGHSFIFDDRGALLGTYRAMGASEIASHPSFRISEAWASDDSGKRAKDASQWIGEDFVDFEATRPGADGRGLGYHILYSLPTPRMVSLNLGTLRERPANCLGAIIFRFPEPDEIMTLPMRSLSAAVLDRKPHIAIHTRVRVEPVPWGMVEEDCAGAGAVVTVSLANTGNAATFASHESVVLTLTGDAAGVEAESGDFDSVAYYSRSGLRSSLARASTIVFKRYRLGAGKTLSTGPIRADSNVRAISGEWQVTEPGGFGVIRGTIDSVKLQEETRQP